MNQKELRLDIPLAENLVREILPEHFTEDYPVLISFLEGYYQYIQEEGEFGNVIDDLKNIRDLSTTELQYLDLIFQEIGLGISQDFFNNPREVAKSFAQFFRVKGTKYSYEGFFRAFYNSPADIAYPKEQIFTLGDSYSIIGTESPKILQDSKIYQVLSVLLKTEESLAKWESLYKKYVHPAGIHLYHEMQIKDTNIVKIRGDIAELEEDLNFYIEDSAAPKIRLYEPKLGKSPIGHSDTQLAMLYQQSTTSEHLLENINFLEVQDSNAAITTNQVLDVWGMDYKEYLNLDWNDPIRSKYDVEKDVHIAPIDLNVRMSEMVNRYDTIVATNQMSATVFHSSDSDGNFFIISTTSTDGTTYASLSNAFVGSSNVKSLLGKPLSYLDKVYYRDTYFSSLPISNNLAFLGRGNYSSQGSSGSININEYTNGIKPIIEDGLLEDIGGAILIETVGAATKKIDYSSFYPYSYFPWTDPIDRYYYSIPDYTQTTQNRSFSLLTLFGKTREELIDQGYDVHISRMYYNGRSASTGSGYVSAYINNTTMIAPSKVITPTNNVGNYLLINQDWPVCKLKLEELTTDYFTITTSWAPASNMRYVYSYNNQTQLTSIWIADFAFVITARKRIIWDEIRYDNVDYDAIFELGHNKSGREIPLAELNNETVVNIKDLLL